MLGHLCLLRKRTTQRPTHIGVRWSGLQFHQGNCNISECPTKKDLYAHLKDLILLDTGSTLKATFMNEEMVTDIRKSATPMKMTTNAGNTMIGLEATIPGNGTTWFNPDQIGTCMVSLTWWTNTVLLTTPNRRTPS